MKNPYKIRLKNGDFEGGKNLIKQIKNEPLFTIITVVLNQEKHLETAIQSLLKQKINNYEYILIDGGSTDNTLKIIRKYNNKISYWISQKDKGIYDAFNKGMLLAKGKYIGILNSDDKYTTRAL